MNAFIFRYILIFLATLAIISSLILLLSSIEDITEEISPVTKAEQPPTPKIVPKEPENYNFSQCDPRIHQLVDRYLQPHKDGISSEMIDDALFKIEKGLALDSMVLFQVRQRSIYVDKRRLDAVPWDTQRFEFLLSRLKDFIIKRRLSCRLGRLKISTVRECEKDFEFVVDCQSNWANRNSFSYPNRTGVESVARYDGLPIFTLTRCIDRNSIPYVQWYKDRDGDFEDWDISANSFIKKAKNSDPDSRQKKAVFRGVFTGMTTFTIDNRPSQQITKDTWRFLGRGALAYLGKHHPGLLDSHVQVKYYNAHCFSEEDRKAYADDHHISLVDQAKTFRYVVYAEGACGWADRLKSLLLFNSTILLQDTKCSEYYKDFLVPWEHYIPVEGDFSDLVEKVRWAREHDEEAADMGMRARMLREELLSVNSMRCYMNLLFEQYSQLFNYPISPREGVDLIWKL